jgi:hypothetical protein
MTALAFLVLRLLVVLGLAYMAGQCAAAFLARPADVGYLAFALTFAGMAGWFALRVREDLA